MKHLYLVVAFIIGTVFAAVFAYLSVVAANTQNLLFPATQISAAAVVFCLLLVLLLNPFLRLIRLPIFERREIFLILIMCTVPAGLSIFGFVHQTIPMVAGLYHPDWNTEQSEWETRVAPYVDPALFLPNPGFDSRLIVDKLPPDAELNDVQLAVKQYAKGIRASGVSAYPAWIKAPDEGLSEWARRAVQPTYERDEIKYSFFGNVPYSVWAGPLLMWGAVCLTLSLFFYSLNELVFRQWYEREKLVFPIAELERTVLDTEGASGVIPDVFRRPSFWAGFALSFLVLVYNGIVNDGVLGGLTSIDLGRWGVDNYIAGTFLEGAGPRFMLQIVFTAVGLAFLLPREISFSVWFFYLFMIAQQLAAVAMGYGTSGQSFRNNWISESNFMTAQGGGAMQVFGLVILWKVRRQMFAFFYRFVKPRGSESFSEQDVRRYTVPSTLFFLSVIAFVYILTRGGVTVPMAIFVVLVFLISTITLVRLVAECGLITFQNFFGPLHLIKLFGLMRFTSVFVASGIGTVILIMLSMFAELKAFIAPTMMNARYLAERSRLTAPLFALGVFVSILVTYVVASSVSLTMVYENGVNQMQDYFFQTLPKSTFNPIVTVSEQAKDFVEFDQNLPWFGLGAVLSGGLIYLRQFVFWAPHPIGLVLFISPTMKFWWFSFFVAWICKKAAVKYCDAESYKAVRAVFVGLIIGEVTAIAFSLVLSLTGLMNMGLDLNRS